MRKLILASTSPNRKAILTQLGLTFEVHPSNYEEDMSLDMPHDTLAEFLAYNKAYDVAGHHDDAVIIGGDTFILIGDERAGKPITSERARNILSRIRGTKIPVISGISILDTKHKKSLSFSTRAHVCFGDFSDEEMEDYIATGEPLDKAGAHAIQGKGASLIEGVEGDFYTIVGLPVFELTKALRHFGIDVLKE